MVTRVSAGVSVVKSAPAVFEAADIVVNQNFATSADGTAIPYFVVGHTGTRAGPGPHAHVRLRRLRDIDDPGYAVRSA